MDVVTHVRALQVHDRDKSLLSKNDGCFLSAPLEAGISRTRAVAGCARFSGPNCRKDT